MELNQWLSELPKKSPTTNMLRWMNCFETLCSSACCFSPDCASIQCDSCGEFFTNGTNRHIQRFVCMQCPLVGHSTCPNCPDAMDHPVDTVFAFPQTTFCHTCFESTAVPHEHDNAFCRIDEFGRHSQVQRRVPPTVKVEITSDMLLPALQATGECFICLEVFSESMYGVHPLGCRSAHSHGVVDNILGVRDCNIFYCNDCYLQYLRSQSTSALVYPEENKCQICAHEKEMTQRKAVFEDHFKEVALTISSAERVEALGRNLQSDILKNAARELKELHRQAWIQQVVDESLASVLISINAS